MNKSTFLIFLAVLSAVIANPVNDSKLEARIVGGKTAKEGQFPYQVSLQIGSEYHVCGGSIINKKWILTAAHCASVMEKGTVVVVGAVDITSKNNLRHNYSQVISHPEYDSKHFQNDLALIKIVNTIKFSRDVQPVRLPKKDMNIPGLKVIVSGWGWKSMVGEITDKLQYVESRVFDNKKCIKEWSLDEYPITNKHLCTFTKLGQGVCIVDTGDPIVTDNVLVGIVTIRMSCIAEYPNLNTNVWKYVDWIKKTMKEN